MIVSGGQLSLEGARSVASRSNFLVHVNFLANQFRGKMLAMLMHPHHAGELKFLNTHGEPTDKLAFRCFIILRGASSRHPAPSLTRSGIRSAK
jgi:hypothetical protein